MGDAKLIPEFKRAWVKALRSGRYEQGKQALCDDGRYCCLGVAADLLGALDAPDEFTKQRAEVISGFSFTGILGTDTCVALGMTDDDAEALIEMNDGGKSFAEIADYIERNL